MLSIEFDGRIEIDINAVDVDDHWFLLNNSASMVRALKQRFGMLETSKKVQSKLWQWNANPIVDASIHGLSVLVSDLQDNKKDT